MNLKTTLFTVTALGALTMASHAQMMSNPTTATPMIPGMMPGTTPGMVTPATNPAPRPNNMMMAPATAGMMATQTMPGMMAMNSQDMVFAARAAEGNLAEITLANLALSKSRNQSVRQTAQVIKTGHTKAQNDLAALMSANGMTMMPMLSATHMAVLDALNKAKGDNFDKMYMAGQTGDHENTIALFAAQTNGGVNETLKGYASQYLPDIVGHTILIYDVARQIKAPGSELRPMLPPVPPGVTPALMGTPIDMTDMTTITRDINAMVVGMNPNMMMNR